jgi:hypothetical protein
MKYFLINLLIVIFAISIQSFGQNSKISELPIMYDEGVEADDVIPIVDTSVPNTKKIEMQSFYDLFFTKGTDTLGTDSGGTGQNLSASTGVLRVDSGTVSTATVDIASGGTGQTTSQAAIDALAPSQTSQEKKFLTTDGTNVSWGNPGLLDVVRITASGDYTKNDDARFIRVFVTGGGGGGGGVDGQGGGTWAVGGGGGGGETCIKIIQNGDVGSTETITIGAGGTGGDGSDSGGSGQNGSTTSFGSHVTAGGGGGGSGLVADSSQRTRNGGSGGTGGSGGDYCFSGEVGDFGVGLGTSTSDANGGNGGSPGYFAGNGGRGNNGDSNGHDGRPGGGGGGSCVTNLTSNYDGGDGGDGFVIVEEYR